MKQDGYIDIDTIMSYLLHNLTYWCEEDIYTCIKQMPIVTKFKLNSKYIKKSEILSRAYTDLTYWSREDIFMLIKKIRPFAISGLYLELFYNKFK